MNLTNYIKSQDQIRFTTDQVKAFEFLDKFLTSEKSIFLLKGYAGTGKTTLIRYLADYLSKEKRSFHLLAPTGRASRVLREKTGQPSQTIHKGIYDLEKVDEEIIEEKDGKKKHKFIFKLNEPDGNIQQIYIVDEASMISDVYSEDNFFVFGSGHLLADLIRYVAPTNVKRRDKVIFVGDPAQLPPVKDPISRALSKEYLRDKYKIGVAEFTLTEVLRQSENSGILKMAIYLRKELENKTRNFFLLKPEGLDVKIMDRGAIVDDFLRQNPTLDSKKSVIINYSNKAAYDFNLKVREKGFKNTFEIEEGDTLMVNQNNYNYDVDIMNGTLVKVLRVGDSELRTNLFAFDENGKKCRLTHRFRRVVIAVPFQGRTIPVNCLILENFLYSDKRALTYAENIALYLDFRKRHPKLKPKTKDFSDALRADAYFNVLKVKYGYAITCHKSQGGEWDKAFVNMDTNQGVLSDSFLRWAYTAVTRASKELVLFNVPKHTTFSKLQYTTSHLPKDSFEENKGTEEIVFSDFKKLKEEEKRLGLNMEKPFIKDKFQEIFIRSQSHNIKIAHRQGNLYQEHYTFLKEGKKAKLTFCYNGKNKFTKIVVGNEAQANKALGVELHSFFNQSISILLPQKEEESSSKETSISFEGCRELEVLFHPLKRLAYEKDITIESVTHNSFQEVYYFRRKQEKASLYFYYKNNFQFTRAGIQAKHCNSNLLLNDLNTIIQKLKKN